MSKRFIIGNDGNGTIAVKDTKGEFCPHTQLFNAEVRAEIFTNDLVDALNGLDKQLTNCVAVLHHIQDRFHQDIVGEKAHFQFMEAKREILTKINNAAQESKKKAEAEHAAWRAQREANKKRLSEGGSK